MASKIEKPLGKILHTLNGEAICRPELHFKAKNARVVTEKGVRIGALGDPFGPILKPYQRVILDNPHEQDLVGLNVIAQIQHKKKRKRRRNYKKNKKSTKKQSEQS